MADQTSRAIVSPLPNPETAEFWKAANEKRLLLKWCKGCKKPHHYPRAFCPHCFSADTEWREATGTGEIYSYSVMRRAPKPYAIAYVTLDEGVSILTNIVGMNFDEIRIGQKVQVEFTPMDDGQLLPMFKPR